MNRPVKPPQGSPLSYLPNVKPEADSARRQPRLVMLVGNDCTNDSRVLRASDTAALAGFETIVLATGNANERPAEITPNGVQFRRLGCKALSGARSGFVGKVRLWLYQSRLEANALTRLFGPELRKLSPDVIHAHDLATLPVASEVGRESHALVIYDSHELELHRLTRSGPIDRWLRGRTERALITGAEAVIAPSPSIARHLAADYGIPIPDVVMNAPRQSERHDLHTLRAQIKLPEETPLVVYIGKLTTGRGLELTVESLLHWPGAHLAMVGPAHAPTARRIRKLADHLRLADRLHIVDPVPPDCVSQYVSSADISIIPIENVCLSYYYSLPNKLLESTMARLPIVVSGLPELSQFVQLGQSGVIIERMSPRAIARAMAEAYRRRTELRPDKFSLARVEAIYGWAKQQATLLSIYARVRARLEERHSQRGKVLPGSEPIALSC
jgi:glycosyltransferase involved in cell wall biosynthesis